MITLITINIIIGFIIMILGIRKINKEVVCAGIIILSIPIFGIILVTISIYICWLENRRKEDGEIFKQELTKKRIGVDLIEYSNIVPISETLILNDTKVKKEILITILREDKSKYIESLKEALKDTDVEAAHYAAVALVDIKDSFNKALETTLKAQHKGKTSLEAYARILERCIKSGLNNTVQQLRLEKTYIEILSQILNTDKKDPFYYEEIISQLIMSQNYEEACTYCNLFKKDYPYNEEAYFSMINYYYEKRDKDNFRNTIRELIKSEVVLSIQGLRDIRFWIGEEDGE